MNTKSQHARPCVVHPSKLTFQSCQNCGRPMCQDCRDINHTCEKCKKTLESKAFQKSALIKASGFSLFLACLTLLFWVFNRPAQEMTADGSPAQSSISSTSEIKTHTVEVHSGEVTILPTMQPEAEWITGNSSKLKDQPINDLKGTPGTAQKRTHIEEPFIPGVISGVDRRNVETFKINHQVQTVNHVPYFQTGPWRIPSLHPYVNQPFSLNPPLFVVPPKKHEPILTAKNPIEALAEEPTIIHPEKHRTKTLVQVQPIDKSDLTINEVASTHLEKAVLQVNTHTRDGSKTLDSSAWSATSLNQVGPWRIPSFYSTTYKGLLLDPPFSVVPPTADTEILTASKETIVTPKEKAGVEQINIQKKKSLVQPRINAVAEIDTKLSELDTTQRIRAPKVVRSKTKDYKTRSMAGHLFGQNKYSKYHLEKVPTSKRIITLSFDGDHLNNCTDAIMKLLDEKGVKANIFLTGKFIQLFPESVIRIQQAGHEIGNHTWNHPHLTEYEQSRIHKTRDKISKTYFMSQLSKTSDIYFKVTGVHFQPFWRAPFGEHNLDIRSWAYSAGYLHIGWTRGYDSMDWMVDPRGKYYLSPQKLKRKLLEDLKNPGHKIVLMHLGSKRPEAERPYTILADFIDKARAKGYYFATISQVMKESHGFQMASRSP